jgi:hypothetical protein
VLKVTAEVHAYGLGVHEQLQQPQLLVRLDLLEAL